MFRVRTIVESKELADSIINGAINESLAVAGYYHEVVAIYRWQGGIRKEVQYEINLSTAAKDKMMQYIRTHHTYLVPDIYAEEVDNEVGMELWAGSKTVTKNIEIED